MSQKLHCGNSSPHASHDYKGYLNMPFWCPGTPGKKSTAVQRLATILALLGSLVGSGMALGTTAHAATVTHGQAVLATAETKAGDWYAWGGNGPNTFDCSGLVVWAARQHGITLPRTTQSMTGSSHLYRVYSPQKGDLAFWYSGSSAYHVEMVTGLKWLTTFGERKSGTRAGYRWDRYFMPTRYYRFR